MPVQPTLGVCDSLSHRRTQTTSRRARPQPVPDLLFTAITAPLAQAAIAPTLPRSLLPIGRAAASAHDAAASMHPLLQGAVALVFYLVHMLVLSKHALAFPFQLLPNDRGQFQCIGRAAPRRARKPPRSARSRARARARVRSMLSFRYDSLAGIAVLVLVALGRRSRGAAHALPPALRVPREGSDGLGLPWRIDGGRLRENLTLKLKAVVGTGLLLWLYQLSGRWAMGIEMKLYWLAARGFPMTVAMHRSLQARTRPTCVLAQARA